MAARAKIKFLEKRSAPSARECTIEIWRTRTLLNLIAWLCQLSYKKKNYINLNTELNIYHIIEYCYNRLAIHDLKQRKNGTFGEIGKIGKAESFLWEEPF